MTKYIVSIVSDQPIPNVAFIRHFDEPDTQHMFISSASYLATRKHMNIAKAAKVQEDRYSTITIDSDRVLVIFKQLNEYDWDKNANYIINITGGNKLMSQAVYTFFLEFPNVEIYYLPIGSHLLQKLYPNLDEITLHERAYINVESFFDAFGYLITSKGVLHKYEIFTLNIFNKIIKARSLNAEPLIFKMLNPRVSHPDKMYYTGAWFEELVYSVLKQKLNLADEYIGMSIKLKSNTSKSTTESDQEIDVFFIYKNEPYFIECKVFNGVIKGQKITTPVFKLSAVGKIFGIRNKMILMIMGEPSLDIMGFQYNRIEDLKSSLGVSDIFLLSDFLKEKSPFNIILNNIN